MINMLSHSKDIWTYIIPKMLTYIISKILDTDILHHYELYKLTSKIYMFKIIYEQGWSNITKINLIH